MIHRFKIMLLIGGLFLSSFTSFAWIPEELNKRCEKEYRRYTQEAAKRWEKNSIRIVFHNLAVQQSEQLHEQLMRKMERDLSSLKATAKMMAMIREKSKIPNQLTSTER